MPSRASAPASASQARQAWRRVDIDPEVYRFAAADGFLALEEIDSQALELEPPPTARSAAAHKEMGAAAKGTKKRKRVKAEAADEAPEDASGIAGDDDDAAEVGRIAAAAAARFVAKAKAKARRPVGEGEKGEKGEAAEAKTRRPVGKGEKGEKGEVADARPEGEGEKGEKGEAAEARPEGEGEKGEKGEAAEAAEAAPKRRKREGKRREGEAGEGGAPADLFAAVAADFAAAAEAAPAEAPPSPEERREAADMSAWAQFGLHERLLRKLAAAGFTSPRPIQREVLPAAVHGRRDVCGAAETGSGKTLAFGLPILHRLLELEDAGTPAEGLFALIIAPTRELASQVASHLRALAPSTIRIVSLLGGLSIDKQKRLLKDKPPIAVATPGRLWELMQDHTVPHLRSIESVRFFVLDEVDRMVEAGHYKELESILLRFEISAAAEEDGSDAAAPPRVGGGRQTFLFSATLMLPPAAREMNAHRLKKHKAIAPDSTMDKLLRTIKFHNTMKVVDLTRSQLVAARLTQKKISCMQKEKEVFLYLTLRAYPGRTIVFCNAITCLQRLRSLLALLQLPVLALQGNMQQRARLKALDRFKSRKDSVLIATDVAARGLDIAGVDLVVHFQLPRSAETYVHRSGRTARGDAAGMSVALIEPSDQKTYRRLCLELELETGLPDASIDTKLIPRVQAVVSLAKQIDRTMHRKSRESQHKKTRQKLVREMELPSESDDEDDEDDVVRGGRQARQYDQQLKQLGSQKQKLAQLLAKIAQPTGLSLHELARQQAQR